jgi:hypothetical protein
MSAAKKKKLPYSYPGRDATDTQERLRLVKLETERLADKIQKSIIDNPKTAKKAALLISLWIEGKKSKTK